MFGCLLNAFPEQNRQMPRSHQKLLIKTKAGRVCGSNSGRQDRFQFPAIFDVDFHRITRICILGIRSHEKPLPDGLNRDPSIISIRL